MELRQKASPYQKTGNITQLSYLGPIEKDIDVRGNRACKCLFTKFGGFISEADLVVYDALVNRAGASQNKLATMVIKSLRELIFWKNFLP